MIKKITTKWVKKKVSTNDLIMLEDMEFIKDMVNLWSTKDYEMTEEEYTKCMRRIHDVKHRILERN